MIKFFKKIPRIAYTAASLSALAAINYVIIHDPFVFIAILILLCHELGHFFIAKKEKASPYLPIFLPIPFIGVAYTKIKNLSFLSRKKVSLYGPVVGSVSALLLFFLNFILSYTSSLLLFCLFVGEIIFNYFGSDGSKYRKAKKMEHTLCIS